MQVLIYQQQTWGFSMKKHKEKHMGHGGHASMPREKYEKEEGEMGHESNLKYAGEFSNPHDLDKATKGLAEYVRKHQMKH